MTVQRYTWEDAVVDAQAAGLIPNGALMVCLKLARAINWTPSNGKPSGLYWANEEALRAVGCSRASYFRFRGRLFELGFFKEVNGNLIPQVPELSLVETSQSQVETQKSLVETAESLGDNPYSEDTYSEDVFSDDSFSEDAPVVADAPTSASDSFSFKFREGTPSLSNSKEESVYFIDLSGVTKSPESLVETHEWDRRTGSDWMEIRRQRPLTNAEQEYINAKSRAYLEAHREPVKVVEEW